MPPVQNLALYTLAAFLLVLSPGPDTLFVIARSVENGRRAGFASALGVCCGELVHIAAAAIGLSAILLSSAVAFTVVKVLGAAYLVFLGIKTLLAKEGVSKAKPTEEHSTKAIFLQGFLTNALNPKVAVFFVAFVPQFAVPSAGNFALQIIVLGLIHDSLGLIWLTTIAMLSGTLSRWKDSPRFAAFQKWFSGGILLLLGTRLLLLQRKV